MRNRDFPSKAIAMAVLSGFAVTALAQPFEATVRVMNDAPGGILAPGESTVVFIIVSWEPQGSQFAGLKGDTIATGNLGTATNVFSPLQNPITPSPLLVLGQAVGGSVFGTDIAIIPNFFTGSPHPWTISNQGMPFLSFTWTAPAVTQSTTVEFSFVPDPIAPNVRLYPLSPYLSFVEANTTYIGSSITVSPAPASLAVLAWGASLAQRRRRGQSRVCRPLTPR